MGRLQLKLEALKVALVVCSFLASALPACSQTENVIYNSTSLPFGGLIFDSAGGISMARRKRVGRITAEPCSN